MSDTAYIRVHFKNKLGLQQSKYFPAVNQSDIQAAQQFIGQLQLDGIVPEVRRVTEEEVREASRRVLGEIKSQDEENG